MIAHYNGRCAKCNGPVAAGSEIEYRDGRAYHPRCWNAMVSLDAVRESAGKEPEPPLDIADRLGFR